MVERRRRSEDNKRFHLQRSISLDSAIILLTALVSGIYYVSSFTHRQETGELKLEIVTKSLEELRADFHARDQRVETAIKDQNMLIQQLVTEIAKEKAARDAIQAQQRR